MEYSPASTRSHQARPKPRVIIHGGAGNITPKNLSEASWKQYQQSLQRILRDTNTLLENNAALDVAVYAVRQLELDPLFNSGRGAVFTRDGKIELEASVMVSRGYKKRGVGVSMLKHVKSPITLAAEMLRKGDETNGGGAQGHQHLSGASAEKLAERWGLDMVHESYFWTKKRWQEHQKGLSAQGMNIYPSAGPAGHSWPINEPSWDGHEYLPQGTVGAVVLDASGTIAVATSTGGLTNKLPGRIGDTPTLGAGFWAEEWEDPDTSTVAPSIPKTPTTSLSKLASMLGLGSVKQCFGISTSERVFQTAEDEKILLKTRYSDKNDDDDKSERPMFAGGISGTGNGDSFLKLSAARTALAKARFTRRPEASLKEGVTWMVGQDGELQKSAGSNWGKTGEGEGGMIGIELFGGAYGEIVYDFNCGGMFRAYIDDDGKEKIAVFKD